MFSLPLFLENKHSSMLLMIALTSFFVVEFYVKSETIQIKDTLQTRTVFSIGRCMTANQDSRLANTTNFKSCLIAHTLIELFSNWLYSMWSQIQAPPST